MRPPEALSHQPQPQSQGQLRRELSLRDLTLFIISSIIGTRWIAAAAHGGPGSITLWLIAAICFAIPLAIAVGTLTAKYPRAGGLYLWVREEFGPLPGFLAFWVYWISIACWFPGAALFYMSAGLYSIAPDLARNRPVVLACALIAIWLALGTNLIGLRVGKWTQNIGGASAWLLSGILVTLAGVVWAKRGSATLPLNIVPDLHWDTVNLWATIAYALSGMELAAMMREEIRDPARALPRAAAAASVCTTAFYASNTLALLILMQPGNISELYGLAQAGNVLAGEFGLGWLAPLIALLILLSAIGQFGGIGTAVSRMPLAAGVDHLLPPAFARIHSRWATPHVSICTLGVTASVLLIAAQIGDTLQAAYQSIISLMVICGFLPYVAIFIAAWRAGKRWSSASGLATTLLAIACSVIPGPEVTSVWLFEGKLAAGTAIFLGSGWLVYRRRRTA